MAPLTVRPCPYCGQPFKPRKQHQQTCSHRCSTNLYMLRPGMRERIAASVKAISQHGAAHRWWKGGIRRDYHPCACGCGELTTGEYRVGHRPIRGYRYANSDRMHRTRAEAALGHPLPRGAQVHHVDRDKSNRCARLVICESHAYHMLLHARERVVRAGGNPNTDRWCSSCKQPRPLAEFYVRRSSGHGFRAGMPVSTCRACLIAHGRMRRELAKLVT